MPITLRPYTSEDLPLLPGGDSPYDDWGPRARTEMPSAVLDGPGGLVVADEDAAVLGSVSWIYLQWGPNASSHNPMIGIWLRPQARGRGVGSEAQRLLVDLFFRHTSTHRVEAYTDIANVAEQRSLERAGLVREGIVRQAQWRDGGYHDQVGYSVLREEWAARR